MIPPEYLVNGTSSTWHNVSQEGKFPKSWNDRSIPLDAFYPRHNQTSLSKVLPSALLKPLFKIPPSAHLLKVICSTSMKTEIYSHDSV